MYWLFILFAFPGLGSLVYVLAVYLPHSRLERTAAKAVSAAARAIDPTREIREARSACDEAPTAQNELRLAAALLEAGRAEEAASHYENCVKGPLAADPNIRIGAARANVECGRYERALAALDDLRQSDPGFRPDAVSLLIARALAGTSRANEARAEYESAVERFGTYEAKAEYAIWAFAVGDRDTAERLDAELVKTQAKWNPLTRELNAPVTRRLKAARELANAA